MRESNEKVFPSIAEKKVNSDFGNITHYQAQQWDSQLCTSAIQGPYETILCQSPPLRR